MTNEEFQKIVLDQFTELKGEISGIKIDTSILKSDVSGLKSDVSTLKSDVSGLKDDTSTLKDEVSGLKNDISTLKSEVSTIKSDMGSKIQQDETLQIVKAIQHNSEIMNAKIDGLIVTTASKEAVADLDAKFEVLNKRLFQQEADLHRLKKAL